MTESATYGVTDVGQVPYLDVAGTVAPSNGLFSLFVLNRDLAKARDVMATIIKRAEERGGMH